MTTPTFQHILLHLDLIELVCADYDAVSGEVDTAAWLWCLNLLQIQTQNGLECHTLVRVEQIFHSLFTFLMQNLLRLSLCRKIVILLGIAAQMQSPLSICNDRTTLIRTEVRICNQSVQRCVVTEHQLIKLRLDDSPQELSSVWAENRLTFPDEKRWHPFTVSKMNGLRSGWAGRWDWDKDCFTFLISTKHSALSSPEWQQPEHALEHRQAFICNSLCRNFNLMLLRSLNTFKTKT